MIYMGVKCRDQKPIDVGWYNVELRDPKSGDPLKTLMAVWCKFNGREWEYLDALETGAVAEGKLDVFWFPGHPEGGPRVFTNTTVAPWVAGS